MPYGLSTLLLFSAPFVLLAFFLFRAIRSRVAEGQTMTRAISLAFLKASFISLLYTGFDTMLKFEGAVKGCSDWCGIENAIIGTLLGAVSILSLIVVIFSSRKTPSSFRLQFSLSKKRKITLQALTVASVASAILISIQPSYPFISLWNIIGYFITTGDFGALIRLFTIYGPIIAPFLVPLALPYLLFRGDVNLAKTVTLISMSLIIMSFVMYHPFLLLLPQIILISYVAFLLFISPLLKHRLQQK